jgi:hypothetical protein
MRNRIGSDEHGNSFARLGNGDLLSFGKPSFDYGKAGAKIADGRRFHIYES